VVTLPEHVRLEVQRILDSAARRILAEQMDADAITTPGRNGHPLDRGSDQSAPLVEGEQVPVSDSDRDRGTKAA
jgi:hypothetical protein